MSDTGRKDLSDKVGETAKPDSQKSTLEQGKEQVTGATDKVAGSFQPSEDKGMGQKAMDTGSSGDDRGVMDKAKDALGMGGK